MMNYWWVTRPKRRLNSVPEILGTLAEISLDQEWRGQRSTHLGLEDALEKHGLKQTGTRRDQTGGGARTYQAWIASLGLIFIQEKTGQLKLTLAGEAIMDGASPVYILKHQILRYQFPSAFSLSRGVNVSRRFKIRPFLFLLKLLSDPSIEFLSEEEIAKIIIVDAENESETCYKNIHDKILLFREKGDSCLIPDFLQQYSPGKGTGNQDNPFRHLLDIANTIINWLEYTQLAKRDDDHYLRIIPDKMEEVSNILNSTFPMIDRPEEHEFFQRKYGLDPSHRKDTRNLTGSPAITLEMLATQKIKQEFITESLKRPLTKITSDLVAIIESKTGFPASLIENVLQKFYPYGAIGSFMTEYFEMAFKGREDATEFEQATASLFKDIFGFDTKHIGPQGLTPDVLLLSDEEGYSAIIDNKAYSKYTISNDHHNRMVHNYIGGINNYYSGKLQLAFFSYIAGGFSANIDRQIADIVQETSVNGSAITVSNIIQMVERAPQYNHKSIREIFSLNRRILLSDLK